MLIKIFFTIKSNFFSKDQKANNVLHVRTYSLFPLKNYKNVKKKSFVKKCVLCAYQLCHYKRSYFHFVFYMTFEVLQCNSKESFFYFQSLLEHCVI